MATTSWVGRAAAEYRTGRPLALLLDFDGTLAPIVSHPRLAALPALTQSILGSLAALSRVRVGVISGRALVELKRLVGLAGLDYAGSGGMHLDLDGEELVDAALAGFDRDADELVARLAGPVGWFPGAWVERKPGCLTVHLRALTPLKAACLVMEVQDVLSNREGRPALSAREVTQALEITPASGWTKGDAVERILGRTRPTPFAVYAGDGANDTEAVAVVNRLGGVTVGIGPEAPAATGVAVAGPEQFAADLVQLAVELTRRRACNPVEVAPGGLPLPACGVGAS